MDPTYVSLITAMGIITGAALTLAGRRLVPVVRNGNSSRISERMIQALYANTEAMRELKDGISLLSQSMAEMHKAEALEMQRINDIWNRLMREG